MNQYPLISFWETLEESGDNFIIWIDKYRASTYDVLTWTLGGKGYVLYDSEGVQFSNISHPM